MIIRDDTRAALAAAKAEELTLTASRMTDKVVKELKSSNDRIDALLVGK